MSIITLKKVYDDALGLYIKNNTKPLDYEKHLSRLFEYAINLKRMDFVSKSCLNPLFREALLKNGYLKSADFMQDVKANYPDNLWFNAGKLIFEVE